MPFILLVLFAAFLIEAIGTFVSVVGLSALFAANPIIIVLAIALDLGKVVGVSFLYKYWKKVNPVLKGYMTAATVVLMLITSTGAFGYLSREFQKAIQVTNTDTVLVQSLEDEEHRLQARKEEIDNQIAKLPDNSVRGRKQLIQQFAPEQNRITSRLADIDKQLPELKVASIKKNTDVGPILYVAQAFNTDPEHAVKWVIFTIIFVFDPLAIALLLAGNFLIEEREKKKALIVPTTFMTIPEGKDGQVLVQSGPTQEWVDKVMAAPDDSPSVIGLPDPMPEPPAQDHTHEELGRERYQEPLIDQLDHVTHEDLGRQKPNDPEDTVVLPPGITTSATENPGRSLPATKPREIITKDQIQKPTKSQLEDSAIRDGMVDTGLGVKVR